MPETRDSTAALARSCGVSGREAKRRRDIASVARKVPRALELLASGAISAEHVAAMAPVASLPGAEGLLEGAGSRSPDELIAAAEDFQLAGEHGEDVAAKQRARRLLRFFNAPGGMIGPSGLLPPLEGATLKARLAAIVDARWRVEHPERASTLGGHGGDTRDQRMADALLEITGVAEAPVAGPSDMRADDGQPYPAPSDSPEDEPSSGSAGRADAAPRAPRSETEPQTDPVVDDDDARADSADPEVQGVPPDREGGAAGGVATGVADAGPVLPSFWRPPTEVKTAKPATIVVFDVDSWKAELLGHGPIPVTESLFNLVKTDLYYSFTTMTGEVLKFGHARCDPTAAQRLAVIARDRHCIYPVCHTPPDHCEIHHVDEVHLDKGVTDVDNSGWSANHTIGTCISLGCICNERLTGASRSEDATRASPSLDLRTLSMPPHERGRRRSKFSGGGARQR